MANNVKQIWREVDVNTLVFPRNFLNDSDLIENNFYRPRLNMLIGNMNLPQEKQTVHIQASTIKSKLCSLAVFARFLINRSIFINIRYNFLTRIITKVQELSSSLKRYTDQREQVMSKHKSDKLIAANKFQSYGSSKDIEELNAGLASLTTSPKSVKLSKQKVIDVRDYLTVSVTYFNCLRVSNLMNIILADISRMKLHNEIDGAHVITNTKYKTSMIYGSKIILISATHAEQIQLYIEHLHPSVSKDDQKDESQRFLFTSSRINTEKPLGQQMDHSAISNAMASSFKKAKLFGKRTECTM